MRFVAAVQDENTVILNAPFNNPPTAGSAIGTTITYVLAESLPSVSVFDYWDPSNAVQRIVDGAAMDTMTVKVNGDFQEFDFAGPARDLIDSASFTSGPGRAYDVSSRAVAQRVRLHDRSRAPGRGVDGRLAYGVFHADRGAT